MTQPSHMVLLGTYNGARFLDEQLASIDQQTAKHIDIYVSDDGSHDETRFILDHWKARWAKGDFTISDGPQRGFAENYRFLISSAKMNADFYSFCDQDDIWMPDKLGSAAARLQTLGTTTPALYAGRTKNVDETGEPLGLSPLMPRAPSFGNALVQSLAGANTMVMNRAAFEIVSLSSQKSEFVSHDWWSYALITGAGGAVNYDPHPTTLYRQHGGNLVGSNTGTMARAKRIRMMFTKQFRRWIDVQTTGLLENSDLLTPDHRHLLRRFEDARRSGGVHLAKQLLEDGVTRQSVRGTYSLYLVASIGRL
ncbi:MAG: glycosyltransferase family 2 protein [Pseudomonadota bacterium]